MRGRVRGRRKEEGRERKRVTDRATYNRQPDKLTGKQTRKLTAFEKTKKRE